MPTPHHTDHTADEESYFVSMTDVFVGLLFIFIIMLMFFAFRFQEATKRQNEIALQQAEVTEQLDEAKRRLQETTEKQNTLIDDLTDAETARAEVLQNLGSFLQSRGLNVIIIKDEGILRLPEEMLFAKANWELNARTDAQKTLKMLGDALDEVLPCYTKGPRSRQHNCPNTKAKIEAIFVEGHADTDLYNPIRPALNSQSIVPNAQQNSLFSIFQRDPAQANPNSSSNQKRLPNVRLAPPRDNLDLSALRATSAFRELLRVKQELSQFHNPNNLPVLSVSGYGEHRPTKAENSESVETFKQRNRRIDLRILMATPRSEDAKQMRRELIERGIRQ